MPHLPSLAWAPGLPGLNAGQPARPRRLGPEIASTPCPLRILARCPAPGGVRPRIAAGKTIFAGSGRASVPNRRQQGAHHGPHAAICRASGSYRHGGGVRSGVCLREWVPVLTRGCRQLAATRIRLLGSEGRDLAGPCRGPCRRPRRSVPVLALRGDDEPRTTDLEGAPDPWASMEWCRGRQPIPSSPQGQVQGFRSQSWRARPGGPARLRRRRGARGVPHPACRRRHLDRRPQGPPPTLKVRPTSTARRGPR
jgi:hypothetical protein